MKIFQTVMLLMLVMQPFALQAAVEETVPVDSVLSIRRMYDDRHENIKKNKKIEDLDAIQARIERLRKLPPKQLKKYSANSNPGDEFLAELEQEALAESEEQRVSNTADTIRSVGFASLMLVVVFILGALYLRQRRLLGRKSKTSKK